MTDQPPGPHPPGYQPFPDGDPTPPGGFPAPGSSGSGYPQPGYPASGPLPAQPEGAGFPPSGPKQAPRRGAAVPVLAGLMVVFLAAAGVALFLWLGAADEVEAGGDKLAELTGQLASMQQDAEEAGRSAADSRAKAEEVGKDVAVLQKEVTGLRKCADRVRATLIAAESGDDAKVQAAFKAMLDNC